jgi:selenide,water dikinase
VGNASSDDAAVYRIGAGQVLVQTVDFFTPVVDDPYLFGAIAAANSLSDVYAMRAWPVLALALVAFPTSVLPVEVLEQILRGGADKVAEAGAVIGGGHSIDHDVPIYGLAVTGLAKEADLTRNSGARPGDALVLTKPLGIGVTVSAGRADSIAAEGVSGFFRRTLLSDAAREEVGRTMAALNRGAVDAMEGFEIHSATDVTGYGLLGHAHEMMEASGTTGQFWVDAIPLLSEARRFAAKGIAPDGSRVNVRNLRPRSSVGSDVSDDDFLLLCDAQTSGGLLVALPSDQAEEYALRCRERGAEFASVVGRVEPRGTFPLDVRKNRNSGRTS